MSYYFAAAASGGGFTERITVSGTTYGTTYLNRTSDSVYCASKIVADGSYTITKSDVTFTVSGTPAFGIQYEIWTDASGHPGTLVGTASSVYDTTGLTAGTSTITFTGISAAVTAGSYWQVVHKVSGADSYYADYLAWEFINGGTGSTYKTMVSADGATWSDSADYVGGFDMPGLTVVYSTP